MKSLLILFLLFQFLYAQKSQQDYYTMKKVAYSYYDHGKTEEAIKYVQQFMKQHPESCRAQNLLAHFYYWRGEKRASEEILKKVVKKCDLAEAKRLLYRVQKKHSKSKKRMAVKIKKTTPVAKENISDDLAFLLKYVKTHPADIENRRFLLHYFISTDKREDAQKMANEILDIYPDDLETLSLIKESGLILKQNDVQRLSKSELDKIVSLLNQYYAKKAYRRFINLYNALDHQGVYMPQYIHMDAVKVAVALQEYTIAKKILLLHEFKSTHQLQELKALIDRKINIALAF
jgi:tetratricopeptide (TPR) repeat protein